MTGIPEGREIRDVTEETAIMLDTMRYGNAYIRGEIPEEWGQLRPIINQRLAQVVTRDSITNPIDGITRPGQCDKGPDPIQRALAAVGTTMQMMNIAARHDADHRRRSGADFWTPGYGTNRLACREISISSGDHPWNPDFGDFYPDNGFLPWPVKTHTRPDDTLAGLPTSECCGNIVAHRPECSHA